MMVTGAAFGWPFSVCDDSLITFWKAQRPSPLLGRTGGATVVLDEAHLLGADQLEELRLLTFDRAPGYAERAGGGRRLPWPAPVTPGFCSA